MLFTPSPLRRLGMRRALLLSAVAVILVLLYSTESAAATPIAGTQVDVFPLDPEPKKDVSLGSQTNFSWLVFNDGSRADLSVSAVASDTGFDVEMFPADFSVPRDSTRVVQLNVSAPLDGTTRSTTINVTFSMDSPVVSSLSFELTVVARRAPATVDALTAFVAIGGIIAIGFTAMLIFERTKVPDILILIGLGVLLGPVALLYFGVVFVPHSVLEVAAPYFAAVALMMILFDGGLNLPLLQVIRKVGAISVQTLVAFVATVVAVASVAIVVLGYPPIVGFLLGSVLGGTSSAVVIGVVRALRVGEDTKVVLTLESVLTDVLCVVAVLGIIELIRGGPGASVGIVFVKLAQAFFVALAVGLAFGLGWLFLLRRASKKPFAYMLTIAMLFILYGVTESAGGSGAMASFVFGLVLGNHEEFRKRLRLRWQFVVDDRIRQFHSELSFVIRTFFFVFLGLVFTFQFGGRLPVSTTLPVLSAANGTFMLFLFGVIAIFLAITAVRVGTALITTRMLHRPQEERRVLWSLMGRGLAAAVLASLPFTIPAFNSPTTPGDVYYQSFMAPYEAQFLNIVFFIIILTVLVTTFGAATFARAPVAIRPPPVSVGRLQNIGFMSQLDLDDLHAMEKWLDTQHGSQEAAVAGGHQRPLTKPGPESSEGEQAPDP